MKKFICIFTLALTSALLACNATSQQVQSTSVDGTKCAGDIASDFLGKLDIASTLADCGMTVEDFIAMIKAKKAALPDGGVGTSPDADRLQAVLDAANAYKAQHAGK